VREAGVEHSGAVTERKALTRAIASLGPGDILLVTRLDRLARSTRDLLNVLDTIANAGAGFKSLADAWADTTTARSESGPVRSLWGRFGTGPNHDKGKSCHGWVNGTTLRASVHPMNSAFRKNCNDNLAPTEGHN
jgi:resolvase-like protein